MQKIVMPDLVRLLARVGSRAMGDPALPVELAEGAAETSVSFGDAGLRGTAEGVASVALDVFNDTADRDDGRVLGVRRRAKGAREADDTRPLLLKTPGDAWLRIALEADAEAVARATRGALSGRAEAGRNARLLAYRRHAPDARCAEAIGADLARFPSALSVGDVLALGVGDACVVQAEGRLSASTSVSWSTLLAAAVPAIADIAGSDRGILVVEVPADADASLAVAIEDGFSVGFARQHASGEHAFRVVLQRRRVDDRKLAGAVGVEAGFADPQAVARVLAGTLASVLDAPAEALHAIREATSFDDLTPRQRAVANALAERFGLEGSAPMQALRDRLEALDTRLAGRLQALAGARASVLLEAEYRRLESNAVLLEAELSEDALRRLHPVLLALDTGAVLADPAAVGGAVSLLRDRVVRRLHGWTIEASLGNWFEFSSAQQREARILERRRIDAEGDRTHREFVGATRYAARANGWSTTYGATFEAVDEGDGTGPACALELWWEEARMRTDVDGLARIVDDAVLWGVIPQAAVRSVLSRLDTALHGVAHCRPRFELVLEEGACRAAFAHLADADTAAWARHAARALPRNPRVHARIDCAVREALYAPAFAILGDARGPALKRRISGALRGADPALVARERKADTPWTAWRVLRRAGIADTGFDDTFRAFAEAAAGIEDALRTMREGREADVAWAAMDAAFVALRPAFEQPFILRTITSLLAGAGAPMRPAARLELAFERDGEPHSLLVAGA